MSKTWYGHHIENIKGEDYVLFKDYLELDKEIEIRDNDIKILLKENENKEKVILKYDNIINRLESYLKYNIETENPFYIKDTFKIVLNRLQELKGDSSNE